GAHRPDRPAVAPAATTGPVPRRVAALLAVPAPRRRATPWVAVLLAVCATTSVCASATGAISFHHKIEVAQGEVTH
ncbi:peptidase M48 Ste24p, partial [Streptosporangium nondiastaticum]